MSAAFEVLRIGLSVVVCGAVLVFVGRPLYNGWLQLGRTALVVLGALLLLAALVLVVAGDT